MQKHKTATQQKGFFDLGFSLAVLALSGTIAYAVTPAEEDRTAAQDTQIEVAAGHSADNRGYDFQH